MSRTFTSAQNTALESSHVNLLMFAKLEFDSGTVYVHNGIGTYTWTESGSTGSATPAAAPWPTSPLSSSLTSSPPSRWACR